MFVFIGISAAEEEAAVQSTGRRSRAEGQPGPAASEWFWTFWRVT